MIALPDTVKEETEQLPSGKNISTGLAALLCLTAFKTVSSSWLRKALLECSK